MPLFRSTVDTRSEAFLANRAYCQALMSGLRAAQESVIAGGRDAQVEQGTSNRPFQTDGSVRLGILQPGVQTLEWQSA